MIQYKIIGVHPEQHSIVVRFYSDVVTEASLAVQWGDSGEILRGRTDFNIDLPIPAPTGAELDELIINNAPTQWLEMQADVLNPAIDTSLDLILPLLGVVKGRIQGGATVAVDATDPALSLANAKMAKYGELASARYLAENSEVTVQGVVYVADRATRLALTAAYISLLKDTTTNIRWKALLGFVTLTAETCKAVLDAMGSAAQQCFDMEDLLRTRVAQAETLGQVAAISWPE